MSRERALRVVFAGGGTGGHLNPGIEVARAIQELVPGAECIFLGAGREAEVRALALTPFRHETLPAAAFSRDLRRLPRFIWGTLMALRAAFGRVRALAPDLVIGLGGYASAAPAAAAALTGRPVYLLEQNVIPGKANRLLSRIARAVFVPWAEAAAHLPSRATVDAVGNPVRKAVLEDVQGARAALGLDPAKRTLLIMGGSQGARGLNQAISEALPALALERDRVQVIHLSGKDDAEALTARYASLGITAHVAAYMERMQVAYSASDLALARAGGTSIAELACRGLPAVLVPLPSAAEDHQTWNARAAVRSGGALLVREAELSGEGMAQALALLLDDGRRLSMAESMRRAAAPDAARKIVAKLLEAVHG